MANDSQDCKVILVTGVTSGVGRAVAEDFVEKGWIVIGIGRSQEKLERLSEQLGESFRGFVGDISKIKDIKNIFEKIKAQYSKIDTLVNNAAVFINKPLEESSLEDVDSIIDTNLKGTIYCSMLALPLITNRIINIASVAATHGIEGQSIYCASKYGVKGFSEVIGQELRTMDVKVSTIFPGGIDTPLWNSNNPYPPGNVEQALKVKDIVDAVRYISGLRSDIVLKEIVLFPKHEWH